MRIMVTIHLCTTLLLFVPRPSLAADEALEVRLGSDAIGIEQVFRRCFGQLRSDGHDPKRMPASEVAACMRPEIEAMAAFAYEVATAYPVSSLTRVALEICTLEQANALEAPRSPDPTGAADKLSWRWLTDCVKEVRWLDHDEQEERLERVRTAAEKLKSD
jgi:hypothetical protein